MRKNNLPLVLIRLFVDGTMIWSGLVLAFYVRMVWFDFFALAKPTTLVPLVQFQSLSLQITVFLLIVMALHGQYRLHEEWKLPREMSQLFWGFSAGYALLLVGFYFGQFIFFSRFIVGVSWGLGLLLLILGRLIIYWGKYQMLQNGLGKTRLLILGTHDLGKRICQIFDQDYHYRIIGFLSEKKARHKTFAHKSIKGSFDDFEAFVEKEMVDEVILAGDLLTHPQSQKIVQICHTKGIKFRFVPDQIDVELSTVQVSNIQNQPIITILNTRMIGWGLVIKTVLDYSLAFILSLALSPLIFWIAYRIRRDEPGTPIFYIADRIGKKGQRFQCYKFRTMVVDAEAQKAKLMKHNQRKGGVFFKMKDDPRITPFGKWLRRTSLDELPQLWNVLRGEMSLVGPRPHLPAEVEQYQNQDRRLIGVRPGMTGFGQINGLANLSFEQEVRFELWYLKNWSLYLDTMIFLKTIGIVLWRKNEL